MTVMVVYAYGTGDIYPIRMMAAAVMSCYLTWPTCCLLFARIYMNGWNPRNYEQAERQEADNATHASSAMMHIAVGEYEPVTMLHATCLAGSPVG